MAVTCLRSKFGFCKFGNQCEKIHFIDICENGRCVGKQCDKRHPVVCFFFEKYGRCKFGNFCVYKHKKTKEQKIQEDFEKLKTEVADLKTELKEFVQKRDDLSFKCDYCDIKYSTEKKLRQHKMKKHEKEILEEIDTAEVITKKEKEIEVNVDSIKLEVHNLKENFRELTEMLDTVVLVKKDTRTEEEKEKDWDEICARDIAQRVAEENKKHETLKEDIKEAFTGVVEDQTLEELIRENSGLYCEMCPFGPAQSKRGLLIHKFKKHSGSSFEPQIKTTLKKVLEKNPS